MFGLESSAIITYVVFLVVVIFVNIVMAFKMQDVVEKKGYTDVNAFALCFFFGIFGYFYVTALPDLELRKMLKSIETSKAQELQETQEVQMEFDKDKEKIYLEAMNKVGWGVRMKSAYYYKEAIKLFKEIEEYKDSAHKITECESALEKLR